MSSEEVLKEFCNSKRVTKEILVYLFDKYLKEKLSNVENPDSKEKLRKIFNGFLNYLENDYYWPRYRIGIFDINLALISFLKNLVKFYSGDFEEKRYVICSLLEFPLFILKLCNERTEYEYEEIKYKKQISKILKTIEEKEPIFSEILVDLKDERKNKNILSCRVQGNLEFIKKLKEELSLKGFSPVYEEDCTGVTARVYFEIKFKDFLDLIENLDRVSMHKKENFLNKGEGDMCCKTEEEVIKLAKEYSDDADFELFHESPTKQEFTYSRLLKVFLREVKNLNLPKDNYLLLGKIRTVLEILEKHNLIGELGYEREYYNYKKEEWRLQHIASLGEAFLEIAIRYLKKDAIGLLDEYIRKFINDPKKYLKPLSYKKYEFSLKYRLEKYQKILESIDNCFNVIIENYPVDRCDLRKLNDS